MEGKAEDIQFQAHPQPGKLQLTQATFWNCFAGIKKKKGFPHKPS